MRHKTIRPAIQDIQARFFEALRYLLSTGEIKSLSAFCRTYNLHRPKYQNLKTAAPEKPGNGYLLIDLDSLTYLARDFGVSSEWLLLGTGPMMAKKRPRLGTNPEPRLMRKHRHTS